jgi:rRNA-processing protein FCF1
MSTENLVIIAVLLVLLAEVTYLVAKLPRQTSGKKRMILVDTSVLIDGRIIAVAQSGFIGDIVAVPRSVIGELQFLADNADHDKRARARYGLDVVKELQEMEGLDMMLLQDGSKATEGVDERLLTLAKKHTGSVIATIDYNLNKVAAVEGITVLNVNELAKSLRMSYLPGERMVLEIVQKGQDSHQGVGYLPDGTMVVVEHAFKHIGQSVEIEFIRSLQTAAGKMMFAKRVEEKKPIVKTVVQKIVQTREPRPPKQQRPARETRAPQQPTEKSVQAATTTPPKDRGRTQGRAPQQQRTVQPAAHSPQPNASSKQRPPRPKTSAQREAALIDLVDKQG